jgi:hypothetical protein
MLYERGIAVMTTEVGRGSKKEEEQIPDEGKRKEDIDSS